MDGSGIAVDINAKILVTVQRGDWPPACAGIAADAARLTLRRSAQALPPASQVLLDITLTDDREQRRLNHTYRGTDAPTNVLAFPGYDPASPPIPGAPHLLGDVVLSLETIRREADEQNKPFVDHLRHLVVHGVLHLLGHDHQTPSAAEAMEAREIAILAEFGVPDPYRDTI